MSPTISCILLRDAKYYTGSGWTGNIRRACLYSKVQATAAVRLLPATDAEEVRFHYVVQNAEFNYYAGDGWVYDLTQAKLYALDDAQAQAERLTA